MTQFVIFFDRFFPINTVILKDLRINFSHFPKQLSQFITIMAVIIMRILLNLR